MIGSFNVTSTGVVATTAAPSASSAWLVGLAYDASSQLHIDYTSAITYHVTGLPLTATGALAVEAGGTPVWMSGGIGITSSGRVAVALATSPSVWNAGVPLSSSGQVCMDVRDPLWSSVKALVANNSAANGSTTFTDQSSIGATVTRGGGAVWSNAQAPTGQTTSVALDGAGDYLQLPTGANYRFAGDFCVEFWARRNGAFAGVEVMFDCRALVASATGFGIYTSVGVPAVYSNGGNQIAGNALSGDTWYHIALDRSGTSAKFWINGVQEGSTWTTAANFSDGLAVWGINSTDLTTQAFTGWIASGRITAASRYQAAFTPPPLPLPTA